MWQSIWPDSAERGRAGRERKYGFGVVIGSTLVVALLVYLLSLAATAPVVGHFIETVSRVIRSNTQP
ncbi:hypothetical protein KGQ71_02455 [Patescibacteria group bacterium]|nr:hypothetical protein [Patescibacteria group bacterium]